MFFINRLLLRLRSFRSDGAVKKVRMPERFGGKECEMSTIEFELEEEEDDEYGYAWGVARILGGSL